MKRGQSKAQQQYIQGFFKKKPCQRQVDAVQCSAGQSQSTRQGQAGQQISSPEPGSTGQSRPVRTTLAAIDLQQQNMSNFYKKFTRHTHTICLDNERSWEQVLSVQWFLFIKREMSCPGACAVPILCHPTCVGAHDFSHGPPWLDLGPPCATPLKKS